MKGILLILCMLSFPALADPVTWYIDGTMDDGGSLTGSFVYDTDDWSDVLLNYANGSVADMTFTFIVFESAFNINAVEEDLADLTGVRVLHMFTPFDFLTDAGGTFNFEDYDSLGLALATCTNSTCSSVMGLGAVTLTSGVLTSIDTVGVPTSVPEPATLGLLAAGLVGLGALRRRKTKIGDIA